MSTEKPDYHDADLMLRTYEMRRENKTREVRDALNSQFFPKSYDDVKAVQAPDHPLNQAWRQLSGYWELVYGLAKNGIVNPDYLVECNGEGIFFFTKIVPYLDQIRADGAPTAFQNLEWATKECEAGRQALEYMKPIIKKYTDAQ